MKANSKSLEVFVYDGAQHGFHNDTTPRYDEKAAKLATERYMDVLQQEPAAETIEI